MKFLKTKDDWGALIIRVFLALVMLPHGVQKVFGWFGGNGFSGTMKFFTETMHLPAALAVLVIAAEFLGSLGLLFGFLTRLAAFGIGSVMVGAIAMVHARNGFFMNWQGNQAGEGFEYHLLAIGMALALIVVGGGKWSFDYLIYRRIEKKKPHE